MPETISTNKIVQGALIFTAALAWNNAAKDTINDLYPFERSGIKSHLIYGVLITIIILILLFLFNTGAKAVNKVNGKKKDPNTLRIEVTDELGDVKINKKMKFMLDKNEITDNTKYQL